MKWRIPAKTFLLGEYAALADKSAILLTTTPYFELSLTNQSGLDGIHPDSPAGLWWQQQNSISMKDGNSLVSGKDITAAKNSQQGLTWSDPYQGKGGLGASSAQFLGSYLAACHLREETPTLVNMLEAYYQVSWSKQGLRPSGYDVIAQSHQACVFINKQTKTIQSCPWPFSDLSFLLIHTGFKLATHKHLQDTTLTNQTDLLSAIVDEAQLAFTQANSTLLINSINNYHNKLTELNLVAEHSLALIKVLSALPEVLAIKGCGALGADVLLILTTSSNKPTLTEKLHAKNLLLLATEDHLTNGKQDWTLEKMIRIC
ncbi:MAG: hypothetical protein ACHP65_08700 [Legionellales bacterium]